jgi:hypothetical protein
LRRVAATRTLPALPTDLAFTMSGGLTQEDSKLVFESSEAIKVVSTFDELHLKEDLLRGIYAYSMSVIFGL